MNADSPLVSVVIPIKNRGVLFDQTADSLIRQTLPAWEALVVDDGSTTEEASLIQRAAGKDPRIRYLPADTSAKGASARRNQGVRHGRGRYFLFLDSDDLLAPECLASRVQGLEEHRTASFLIFPTEVFKERIGDCATYWNTWDHRDDLDRFLAVDPPWATAGGIWRKETLALIGPWDELAPGWQDWEFHIRALSLRLPYHKIPRRDNYWRTHQPDSLSYSSIKADRHSTSRLGLVGRIIEHLRQNDQLTKKRKKALAALIYGIAHWNAEEGSAVVRQIMRRTREHRLTPSVTSGFLTFCALLAADKRGIRIAERFMRVYYRNISKPFSSNTFLKAPAITSTIET